MLCLILRAALQIKHTKQLAALTVWKFSFQYHSVLLQIKNCTDKMGDVQCIGLSPECLQMYLKTSNLGF